MISERPNAPHPAMPYWNRTFLSSSDVRGRNGTVGWPFEKTGWNGAASRTGWTGGWGGGAAAAGGGAK